jgi:hypothetical protein
MSLFGQLVWGKRAKFPSDGLPPVPYLQSACILHYPISLTHRIVHRTKTRDIQRIITKYKASLVVLRISVGNGFRHTVRNGSARENMT